MEKYPDNSIFQYLLILCLSFALILSQSNRLHMHLQHDEQTSVAHQHTVDVHSASTLHDFDMLAQGDDHSVIIDISPDNLVKKTGSLSPLLLILLLIGLFLYLPRGVFLQRPRLYKTASLTCYNLLHPPLRAPPVK